MTLPERLATSDENTLDRRKISEQSKRELAEYIHYNDTELALQKLFRIVTGSSISEHKPYRRVAGDISTTHSLENNQYLVVDLSIGDNTITIYIDHTQSDTYLFEPVYNGTYDITVTPTAVETYNPDTLEINTTDIVDSTVIANEYITVDISETQFDTTVTVPTIKISDIILEDV